MIVYILFFNDTATTEIYTLSLHDALPISVDVGVHDAHREAPLRQRGGQVDGDRRLADAALAGGDGVHAGQRARLGEDRKSTRLNSSHANISYAVFCLKKKNITLSITLLLC